MKRNTIFGFVILMAIILISAVFAPPASFGQTPDKPAMVYSCQDQSAAIINEYGQVKVEIGHTGVFVLTYQEMPGCKTENFFDLLTPVRPYYDYGVCATEARSYYREFVYLDYYSGYDLYTWRDPGSYYNCSSYHY